MANQKGGGLSHAGDRQKPEQRQRGDKERVEKKRAGEVAVQQFMGGPQHAATGAIQSGERMEGAFWIEIVFTRGEKKEQANGAANRHAGSDAGFAMLKAP